MPPATTCPELNQYQRLASGQLSEIEREGLLEHLEGCDACATRLNTLPEQDTLVGLMRQGQTLGGDKSREAVARLVERLKKLRPGEVPPEAKTVPPAEPAPVPLVSFTCPACGKSGKVKAAFAGKQVKCPQCKAAVRVPARAAGPQTMAGADAAVKTGALVTQSPADAVDRATYDFLAPAQSPEELGRLGPYRVLKVLGAGGMGVVFQAEDPHLQRLVALKAMLPALAASESARQRFLREARAAAALKHDHIVTIFQVGEDRGAPFLAMEFLEGESLDDRVKREGRLPPADVVRIGREMAEGLAAAHERGLIHRDVKPGNVWLEGRKGRVKILDFGLARAATDEAHLTQSGAIVGTPAYMAPEQGRGEQLDHRCDLFSLGCVLYRLATGEAPFRGSDMISTLMSVAVDTPRPPHELAPDLPRALSELILGLLAKAAGDRPKSAQAVVESLDCIAAWRNQRLAARRPAPADAEPSEGVMSPGAAKRAARPKRSIRHVEPKPQTVQLLLNQWPILAGAAACLLLLGLAGLWAAGVFKLKTQEGTIVLDNLPADAEVFVDGEKIALQLTGDGKPIEIRVAPGKRTLEIKTAGVTMETREVTLGSGERKPIGIRLEPPAVASEKPAPPTPGTPHPVDEAWLKRVAALPTAEQMEAVVAKLKELNPGFDGKETHNPDSVVTQLTFHTDKVTDISPLRALTGLHELACSGGEERGRLTDLSPLKGMRLTSLDCPNTTVSDLSPLKDMQLAFMNCEGTPVSDLSPLKDVNLTNYLNCGGTRVSDLSPLKGMKLTCLGCWRTQVSDLSPLKDMKLRQLLCSDTQVSDLSPLKGMPLRELSCDGTKVSDLTPLKGMPLTNLSCNGTKVSDLSLLKDMKLTRLNCSNMPVSDLSPLKDMPLKELFCDFVPERDAKILRSIKTLERINDKPAAEFWKEVDAKK